MILTVPLVPYLEATSMDYNPISFNQDIFLAGNAVLLNVLLNVRTECGTPLLRNEPKVF